MAQASPDRQLTQALGVLMQVDVMVGRYMAFLLDRGTNFQGGGLETELIFLASREMLLTMELAGQPDDKRATVRKQARIEVVIHLWTENRWTPPLSELVDQIFPGEEMTDEGIETYLMQDLAEGAEQNADSFEAIRGEIVGMFTAAGYKLRAADFDILASVTASIALMRRHGGLVPESSCTLPLGGLQQLIILQASRPDHPVWDKFLDRYDLLQPG